MSPNQLCVAVKGVVIHNRKMLILHTSENEVLPGLWECPGGKMEFGEGIEAALLREVMEETGLTVSVGRLLYAATFFTDPTRQLVILNHACRAVTDRVTLSEEHDDYRWASRREAREMLSPVILEDFDRNHVLEDLDMD